MKALLICISFGIVGCGAAVDSTPQYVTVCSSGSYHWLARQTLDGPSCYIEDKLVRPYPEGR
jgi:hypothetical protein